MKKIYLGAISALLLASCTTIQKVTKTAKDVKEIGETIYDFNSNKKPFDKNNPKDVKEADKYFKKDSNYQNKSLNLRRLGRIDYIIYTLNSDIYDVYSYHVFYSDKKESYYLYDVKKSKMKREEDLKTYFKIKSKELISMEKAIYIGWGRNDSLVETETFDFLNKRDITSFLNQ